MNPYTSMWNVGTEEGVAWIPDAVAALDPTRPITWISGHSAASDI
jgi:L-lactate dehydrogenase complex protein LldG